MKETCQVSRPAFLPWLFAALLAILLVRSVVEYSTVWKVARNIRGLGPAGFVSRQPDFVAARHQGLAECVAWTQERRDIRMVYGLPHEADRYLFQRLSEMLYPVAFKPLPVGPLAPGSLLIVPAGVGLDGRSEPVFQRGVLQVFEVRP